MNFQYKLVGESKKSCIMALIQVDNQRGGGLGVQNGMDRNILNSNINELIKINKNVPNLVKVFFTVYKS